MAAEPEAMPPFLCITNGGFSFILIDMHTFRSSRFLKSLILGLLLIALAAAVAFALRDRLVQNLVRPLLVQELSRRFGLEAAIETLSLRDGELRVEKLHLERAGTGRLDLKQLVLPLSWSAIKERQLSQLVLVSPVITLFTPKAPKASGPASWPAAPPLSIDEILVRDGILRTAAANEEGWQFEGRGSLDTQWSLSLQFHPLRFPQEPLSLRARGNWDGPFFAEAESFEWRGVELLERPLTLKLDSGRLSEADAALRIASLSDDDLRPLLTALGLATPANPSWRAQDLRLSGEWKDGRLALDARLASLALGKTQNPPQMRDVRLQASAEAGAPVDIEVEARLGRSGDALSLQVLFTHGTPSNLELKRLSWRGQEVLTSPFVLSFAAQGAPLAAGLHLDRLDTRSLGTLLALADIRLAPEPRWSLRDLTLEPAWDCRVLHLKAKAASGTIRSGGREVRLMSLAIEASGWQKEWDLTGSAGLGGTNALEAHLQLHGERLQGGGLLKLPALEDLQREQPGIGLPFLSGALTLKAGVSGTTARPKIALNASTRGVTKSGTPELPSLDLQAEARLSRHKGGWQLSDGALKGSLSGTVSANLTGSLSGSLGEKGWSAKLAELRIDQLSWTSSDGMSAYAGDRMSLRGEFAAAAGDPLGFSLQGDLSGGELLHGAYYVSFAGFSAKLALQGTFDDGNLHLQEARAEVPQLGRLSCAGELGSQGDRFSGALELPDLHQALEEQGRHLLGDVFPRLKALSLSGALRVKASGFRRGPDWGVQLQFAPRDLSLSWADAVRASGFNGVIPLQLGTSAEGEGAGRLAWAHLSAGPLVSGPGEVEIRSRPGTLQMPGSLRLDLAGGKITLADFTLALPPQETEMAARLEISEIDLQSLTRELGWPEMRGTLGAELGRLLYRKGELSVPGEAAIDVFEGHIRVQGMRVRELFSRYPVFHADIDFSGINLYNLTRTLSFGEMNGVVDGYIHQLSLLGATPSHFEASLHTRAKGKRNISVKALKNLSILSQGGLSAALSRGIYRFIDFYRYRSIGFVCSLENDVFRLRGTALEGADRYLVYGGLLPPRIDVVTTSPVISFKEMVKRLKRLDRAGGNG